MGDGDVAVDRDRKGDWVYDWNLKRETKGTSMRVEVSVRETRVKLTTCSVTMHRHRERNRVIYRERVVCSKRREG